MANTLRFKRGLLAGLPSAAVGEPLFTTDTFDLYIGTASGTQKYQKFIASGTTSQLLRGDGSLLTMPIVLTSPSNGQVLKYNGTSWVNDSDAGITGSGVAGQVAYFTGATTQGGSNNLFWDATNNRLGIGTNTPLNKFELRTSNNVTFNIGNTGSEIDVKVGTNGGTYGIAANYYAGNFNFLTDAGSGTFTQKARITGGGNFIINNSSTDNGLRFQVTGDGYFSGSVGIGTATPQNDAGYKSITLNGTSGGQVGFKVNDTLTHNIYGDSSRLALVTIGALPLTFTTNSVERMRLDASGNLGLGVTPSAWNSAIRGFDFGSKGALYAVDDTNLINNAFNNSSGTWIYKAGNTLGASRYFQYNGAHQWFIAPSGTAGNAITFTQAMTLDSSGRLGIGTSGPLEKLVVSNAGAEAIHFNPVSGGRGYIYAFNRTTSAYYGLNIEGLDLKLRTGSALADALTIFSTGNVFIGTSPTDATYKLDVNGTMRVSGASTLNDNLTIVKNTNGYTRLILRNTTSGTDAIPYITITTGAGDLSSFNIGKYSASTTTYKFVTANDAYLSNITNGDIAILNDFATGSIKMAAGGSSTAHFTIASTGAATFSSSVTAASFIPTSSTAPTNGMYLPTTNNLGYATNSTERMRIDASGNVSIAQTQSAAYRLDVVGSGIRTAPTAVSTGLWGSLVIGSTLDSTSNYFDAFRITGSGAGTYAAAANNILFQRWDGSTWTTQLTLNQFSGAATFSSSVSATSIRSSAVGTFGFNTANNGEFQIYATALDGMIMAGRGSAHDMIIVNKSGSDVFRIPTGTTTAYFVGNVGIAMTPSYKLDVTGEARVSNAIAIGTTPDTNLPFKILKNINSTVGIRFENTSTGNVAYSAVQFGTDVTGGTKFANLVYSSSGITESGAYKQNGTSIINTGTGGLNLLAVDGTIRFFTSSSNGTLRAEIANDGFINHYTGTAPSTNLTDGYRQYSADITAGNAAPHFRTENGGIIKLYQQTTGVTSATYIGGAGTGLTDSDTFDGYTIAQIVKALRNAGLLA